MTAIVATLIEEVTPSIVHGAKPTILGIEVLFSMMLDYQHRSESV